MTTSHTSTLTPHSIQRRYEEPQKHCCTIPPTGIHVPHGIWGLVSIDRYIDFFMYRADIQAHRLFDLLCHLKRFTTTPIAETILVQSDWDMHFLSHKKIVTILPHNLECSVDGNLFVDFDSFINSALEYGLQLCPMQLVAHYHVWASKIVAGALFAMRPYYTHGEAHVLRIMKTKLGIERKLTTLTCGPHNPMKISAYQPVIFTVA